MSEEKKSYYAVIPASVRYAKIPQGAKLLYGEITALCNEKGFCWASNKYFAELYEVSERTIGTWLEALENENFIYRSYDFKGNTKEIDKRYISIRGVEENFKGVLKKTSRGVEENCQDNNTLNNNTNINIIMSTIVDHLNKKTDSKYKTSTKSTQKHIKARLNEGYTLEDFIRVIDIKVAEWGDNEKMSQYLRPDTLFGTKFESYLNQKPVVKKNGIEVNPKQREGMVDIVDWGM